MEKKNKNMLSTKIDDKVLHTSEDVHTESSDVQRKFFFYTRNSLTLLGPTRSYFMQYRIYATFLPVQNPFLHGIFTRAYFIHYLPQLKLTVDHNADQKGENGGRILV